MNGQETDFRAWIRKAEEDLLAIHNEMAAEQTPWSVVCFHAQQAGEKYLKAFLVHAGKTPPHTHDLLVLLALCGHEDKGLEGLEEDCRCLAYYAVAGRYPVEIIEPDEGVGRRAAEAAARVCEAVRALLPET